MRGMGVVREHPYGMHSPFKQPDISDPSTTRVPTWNVKFWQRLPKNMEIRSGKTYTNMRDTTLN